MPFVLAIISIVSLLLIMVEDFRFRQIRIVWFAVLFVSLLVSRIGYNYNSSWLFQTLINVCSTFILISSSIFLLVVFRHRNLKDACKMGGLGDLLMIAIFIISFESVAYLSLLLVSSVFALVVQVIISLGNRYFNKKIPLAGYMAAVMIIILVLQKADLMQLHLNEIWLNLLFTA